MVNRIRTLMRAARQELSDFAFKNLVNVGAVAGVCLLLAATGTPLRLVGMAAALASLATIVWRRRRAVIRPTGGNLLGYFVSVRTLLLLAVGAGYALRRPGEPGWVWTATATAMVVTLSEPMLKTMLGTTRQVVDGLPGVPAVPRPRFHPGWLTTASFATITLGGVLAVAAAPAWLYLAAVLVTAVLAGLAVESAVRANVVGRKAERGVRPALERLQPAFAVYYAAKTGARYQLGMWLPYLERLDRPFIVITREPETVPTIRELTSAPILIPKPTAVSVSLDAMVVPSMKAAFYVQGSPANQTFQRYRQLTHVWLNHGDSDKQANFHPRHATYDKLFVSGQLGIERYANHGIDVPADRFAIVGRPQVENIETLDHPLPARAPRTVLYAPTWKGGRPSTNYSSLPLGEQIVRAVLERGSSVIFRPHPVSYSDAEDARRIRTIQQLLEDDRAASVTAGNVRNHVWGQQAEKEWDVAACFNASDALITDVSSIASDYLASGKPFAMVAVLGGGETFREEFPLARVAYVIEKDLSTLPSVLDQLHGDDTLASARLAYRTYCLGEQVGPHAADQFLRIAGAIVDGRQSSPSGQSGIGPAATI
ncbi:CDP-glycerol glycerophosphotransferase family protein [Microlunatus panaciterrae]|uniref:CDP-Glycerol:Poly(Glycerophosphate) glycerophosphotransferase n=1 Tax=Microlunatus panaciterrae TaxID=400768 RepID=A0ABS2RF72_9ACTN|nr:CDP-glycerol glycerophosphotransferase family protein [Microlunatus panaciterrae]MBM7797645.1 hypothetical protein [Microlunatus panaciterrae]